MALEGGPLEVYRSVVAQANLPLEIVDTGLQAHGGGMRAVDFVALAKENHEKKR